MPPFLLPIQVLNKANEHSPFIFIMYLLKLLKTWYGFLLLIPCFVIFTQTSVFYQTIIVSDVK